MSDLNIRPSNKRILVVTGHYGSGKTEFSVSLAMQQARSENRPRKRLAIIDLDIANPYFRSRERRSILEAAGIGVYGSLYKTEITAELPALGATIRTPLEDKDCFTIVDAGGNDSGALVLNQFKKYLTPDDAALLAVLNFNRFETRDISGALEHIKAIEAVTGLTVEGLVNNTHLLRETTADTVRRGHQLSMELSDLTGKPLWCDCYPAALVRARIYPAYRTILCRSAFICGRPGLTNNEGYIDQPKGAKIWRSSR